MGDWDSKLGKNFTDNSGIHHQIMMNKNIETEGSYQATVSGMYGEFTIAAVFKSLPKEYVVLNDILLQTGTKYRQYTIKDYIRYGETPWQLFIDKGIKPINNRIAIQQLINNNKLMFYEEVKRSSQIDHVIVSPYGLFVIETKNHKGYVFGDINSKVWTQVLKGMNGKFAYRGHDHYTFMNPVHQNELHLQHLSQQLHLSRNYMTGMIVFTNPEAYLGNINCNCCYTLDMLTRAILSYNQAIWNKKQTESIIDKIENINSNKYSLAQEHIKYVKDIQHRSEINRSCKM